MHLCRSRRRSVLSRPLFDNHLITTGTIAEVALILLIGYTAGGNAVFGTAPIDHRVWLFVVPFAAAMLMLEEGRKAIVRWRDSGTIASAGSRRMGAATMAGRS